MVVLKGPVRFRFRRPEDDVDVLVQGEASWVQSVRDELGLSDVGWVQPMAVTGSSSTGIIDGGDEDDEDEDGVDDDGEIIVGEGPVSLPGPPPDPSRIPVVRRVIGSISLDEEMKKLGIEKPRPPTVAELEELIEDMEDPDPLTSVVSADPMAEAWLQSLMHAAVRKFGVTALPLEVIDEAVGDLLDRHGEGLDSWLDGLWRMGKLVKVHGADKVGYGPTPTWLEAD